MDTKDVLTPSQMAAVTTLASGGTLDLAAAAAGVSSRTISRWKAEDVNFQKALAAAQADIRSQARAEMLVRVVDMVEVLHEVATDASAPPSTRVQAANCFLNHALKEDATHVKIEQTTEEHRVSDTYEYKPSAAMQDKTSQVMAILDNVKKRMASDSGEVEH